MENIRKWESAAGGTYLHTEAATRRPRGDDIVCGIHVTDNFRKHTAVRVHAVVTSPKETKILHHNFCDGLKKNEISPQKQIELDSPRHCGVSRKLRPVPKI